MNIIAISELVGIISFILLLSVKFYILININTFKKSGRIAGLWLWIYLFFLIILRVFSFFNFATRDQLIIISSFASVIPLVAISIQLFITRKIKEFDQI